VFGSPCRNFSNIPNFILKIIAALQFSVFSLRKSANLMIFIGFMFYFKAEWVGAYK